MNDDAITRQTCTRCGATWYPRRPGRPAVCAICHSPYWDKPRVYELRNRPPARHRGDGEPIPTPPPPPPPQEDTRAGELLANYRRMRAAARADPNATAGGGA